MNEYTDEAMDDFQWALDWYGASLTEVKQERTPMAVAMEQDATVTCRIEFFGVDNFKDFVIDTGELYVHISRRGLHNEHPPLKEAYEHYQTLLKLYGG